MRTTVPPGAASSRPRAAASGPLGRVPPAAPSTGDAAARRRLRAGVHHDAVWPRPSHQGWPWASTSIRDRMEGATVTPSPPRSESSCPFPDGRRSTPCSCARCCSTCWTRRRPPGDAAGRSTGRRGRASRTPTGTGSSSTRPTPCSTAARRCSAALRASGDPDDRQAAPRISSTRTGFVGAVASATHDAPTVAPGREAAGEFRAAALRGANGGGPRRVDRRVDGGRR